MWYSVSLLLKRTHPETVTGTDESLWEESIILVQANCEEGAKEEAERMGAAENQVFQAVSGEIVKWQFVGVTAIHEILDESLKHGTEVFSRFLRDSNVKSLLALK